MRIKLPLLGAAILLAAGTLAPNPAAAWWHRHGPFWGGGIYLAPPVVVAPPVYYAAPPVYAAPPAYAGPAGQACYAGPYVCPLEGPSPVGAPCSCPTNNQTRSYGTTR